MQCTVAPRGRIMTSEILKEDLTNRPFQFFKKYGSFMDPVNLSAQFPLGILSSAWWTTDWQKDKRLGYQNKRGHFPWIWLVNRRGKFRKFRDEGNSGNSGNSRNSGNSGIQENGDKTDSQTHRQFVLLKIIQRLAKYWNESMLKICYGNKAE
jgi:hypothetical protein